MNQNLGKTTAILGIAQMLRNKGHNVIVGPEAATLLFGSGANLDLKTYTEYESKEFQKHLMSIQMLLEDQFRNIASIKPSEKSAFLLCDRGLMDGSAYIDKELWEVILEEMNLDIPSIMSRYDMVIHLVTAADGAQEFYQTENNDARAEDLKLAMELDRKLQLAWCGHHCYFIVDNTGKSFSDKMKKVENWVSKILGMPFSTAFHKKYLVRSPKGKLLKMLIKEFEGTLIEIQDSFLEVGEQEVKYLRKVVSFRFFPFWWVSVVERDLRVGLGCLGAHLLFFCLFLVIFCSIGKIGFFTICRIGGI